MASWVTIKTLLMFFGPMLLPKAITYYKSIKNRPSFSAPIRPPPAAAKRALNVLYFAAIIALITTHPYFAPPDIFKQTESRIKIPTGTLFTRLASLSNGTLSESQTALQQHLNSLESRLLYFKYGPDVMTYCKFCDPEDAMSYFYYAIPSILAPHILHIGILALCTSGLFAGPEARRWRIPTTFVGVGLAVAELWITSSYNYQANARAERLSDIDPFFWNMRFYRSLAMAAVLTMTGLILYLSSTNRLFVEAPPPFMQVEIARHRIDSFRSKVLEMGFVRNAALRNPKLRGLSEEYWLQAADNIAEKLQDKEVREGINNALSQRINLNQMERNADAIVNGLFAPYEEKLNLETAI